MVVSYNVSSTFGTMRLYERNFGKSGNIAYVENQRKCALERSVEMSHGVKNQ
jgi:hypothetical protein